MSEWGPKIVQGGKPAYSPDEVYLDSRDKKGFSTTLRVNIPPGVMQQLTELVERKDTLYRSKADVVRDAIIHRLRYVTDHGGSEEAKRIVDGLIARERTIQIIETREQFHEFMEKLGAGLTGASEGARVTMAKEAMEYARSLGEGFEGEMRGFLGGRGL